MVWYPACLPETRLALLSRSATLELRANGFVLLREKKSIRWDTVCYKVPVFTLLTLKKSAKTQNIIGELSETKPALIHFFKIKKKMSSEPVLSEKKTQNVPTRLFQLSFLWTDHAWLLCAEQENKHNRKNETAGNSNSCDETENTPSHHQPKITLNLASLFFCNTYQEITEISQTIDQDQRRSIIWRSVSDCLLPGVSTLVTASVWGCTAFTHTHTHLRHRNL